MDLKSRGHRGRSFIQRAVFRTGPEAFSSAHNYGEHEDDDLTKKVEALFSDDLLFERLHSEPRLKKTYSKSVAIVKKSAAYVKKQKFATKAIVVLALSVGAGGLYQWTKPKQSIEGVSVTSVAGATDSTNGANSGIVKESPSFGLLKPIGRKDDQLETVRISPPGQEPTYVFIDTLDGQTIRVNQQKVPKSFDYNRAVELERVTKEFQATDFFVVDGNKVYKGLQQKTGVQSLFFIKDDLLVGINSSQVISDDLWTGYIIGLKKY